MIWLQFFVAALVIVLAGVRLARYGDILGEKSGLGRSWIGVILLAATTSLPELFTGFGATALASLPDIAVGDVLGSCMFNLLILSMMDLIQPEPLSARAHQGHVLSVALGLLLIGVVGVGLLAGARVPALGWVSPFSVAQITVYLMAMRAIFRHEQHRRASEVREVADHLQYGAISLSGTVVRYVIAAAFVVGAALWLPGLGAELSRQTGLGEAFVGSLFIAITTSLPEIVVSLAAVRIGAIDLGIANILGSNLFNIFILGLDDVFYWTGPIAADTDPSHVVTVLAVVVMQSIFLVGLTIRVMTKRFAIAWDTGTIAVVYALAVVLAYQLKR